MAKFTAHYRVGDTLTYQLWDGENRTIVVETKERDIKNGRPGFAGSGYWGYDDQIVSITRKMPESMKRT